MNKNILKHKWTDSQLVLLVCCWLLMALASVKAHAQTITDGKYTVRYEDGVLKERGFYSNGQKHKTWSYYNPNGSIDRKEKYENGVLKWQIFYSKGRIIKTIDEKGIVKTRKGCGC